MVQNSRSEGGAIFPTNPRLQRDEVPMPTAAEEQQDRQSVTVTTTTSHGVPDIIPTLIPALQSSAYVLVILGGFLAWSSRSLAVDFCQKHITLVETLKENLDSQLVAANAQLAVLQQLAANNEKLVNTVANITERNSPPRSPEPNS